MAKQNALAVVGILGLGAGVLYALTKRKKPTSAATVVPPNTTVMDPGFVKNMTDAAKTVVTSAADADAPAGSDDSDMEVVVNQASTSDVSVAV